MVDDGSERECQEASCRGEFPASSAVPPGMEAALHLSSRTLAWLADNPVVRKFARSVWDEITELERAGHRPATVTRWRRVLADHGPTSTGRCRACRPWRWRSSPFPCIVWHEIRSELPSFPRRQPLLRLPPRRP